MELDLGTFQSKHYVHKVYPTNKIIIIIIIFFKVQ